MGAGLKIRNRKNTKWKTPETAGWKAYATGTNPSSPESFYAAESSGRLRMGDTPRSGK